MPQLSTSTRSASLSRSKPGQVRHRERKRADHRAEDVAGADDELQLAIDDSAEKLFDPLDAERHDLALHHRLNVETLNQRRKLRMHPFPDVRCGRVSELLPGFRILE